MTTESPIEEQQEDLLEETLKELEAAQQEGRIPVLPAPDEWVRWATGKGKALLHRLDDAVTGFELELGYQGEAFNHLLDRTDLLDKKISQLAETISQAKLEWARASTEALKEDLRQVAEQLQLAMREDQREQVTENLEILEENLSVALLDLEELKSIGAPTGEVERYIQAMEAAIRNLKLTLQQAPRQTPKVSKAGLGQELNQALASINQLVAEIAGVIRQDVTLQEVMERQKGYQSEIGKWQAKRVRFVEAGLDTDQLDRHLSVLEKSVGQLSQFWQSSLSTKLAEAIDEEIRQINEQIGFVPQVESMDDIQTLRENWEVMELNITDLHLQAGALAPSQQGELQGHLKLLLDNWQRFDQVINDAAERIRLSC